MASSINELIKRRFAELNEEISGLKIVQANSGFKHVEPEKWQKWTTSVLGLLQQVFGTDSPHFKNFQNIYSRNDSAPWQLEKAKGVFYAAKADYAGGYLFSLESNITGEIFGDFVALAKEALNQNNKDVAAVLACAALEDALKRHATMNGLDVSNKSMQDVVGALKSKGLVSGAQKSLLDTMPKIRDYAMHANWDKISPPDVSSVIGFVEQFTLLHFTST